MPIEFRASIVHRERNDFAHAFADTTKGERPISLCQSLHEARGWLDRVQHSGQAPSFEPKEGDAADGRPDRTPRSDPQRQKVMLRGDRRRDLRAELPHR